MHLSTNNPTVLSWLEHQVVKDWGPKRNTPVSLASRPIAQRTPIHQLKHQQQHLHLRIKGMSRFKLFNTLLLCGLGSLGVGVQAELPKQTVNPSMLAPSYSSNAQGLDIEFLLSKPELSPRSQLNIKHFLSKHRLLEGKTRVQELRASIEEDGSYLESLCEKRLKALESFLLQTGLESSGLMGACPLAQLSTNAKGQHPSSHLSVVFEPLKSQDLSRGKQALNASPSSDASKVGRQVKGKGAVKESQQAEPHEGLSAGVNRSTAMKKETDVSTLKDFSVDSSMAASPPTIDPKHTTRECASTSPGPCEEAQFRMGSQIGGAPKGIVKGSLVHLALGELARSEGWTFIWYPKFSWKAIADISFSLYPDAQSAVAEVVDLLRLEGKPLQLRVSVGNKVMEILSTEVSHD